MKKAAIQIAVLSAVLIAVCFVCRFLFFHSYRMYVPLTVIHGGEAAAIRSSDPGIVSYKDLSHHEGGYEITLEPGQPGKTFLEIVDADEQVIASSYIHVNRFGTIVDLSSGGFSGDTIVLISVTVFFLTVSAVMFYHYKELKGPDYYSLASIYFSGFFFFTLFSGLTIGIISIRHLTHPEEYSMLSVYGSINGASMNFMAATMLPAAVFALALIVSNVILLKHEKAGLKNFLGIIAGVILLLAEAIGLYFRMRPFTGSEREYHLFNTFENVYATVFVYFECILLGAMICSLKAAKCQPAENKDYIIVLGCYFRQDGTLPPLLKGRADAALSFWRKQYRDHNKQAVFIPAGGKGEDEPVAEAYAIRSYLITNGIPDELIVPECHSRNTYENMLNAKCIIDQSGANAGIAYATTNYHVFRSGVLANAVGLRAEGIGSKTKWWYWPNAFLRECIGLLARRWKTELLFLLSLILFFAVLSMILY